MRIGNKAPLKISQAFLIVNISEFSISVELTILSMLLLLPISEELLAVCTCKPLLCAMCSQSCKFCFRCCFQSSFGSSCTNCISPQQGELQDGWKSVDSCLFPMLQTQWFAEPSTVELSLHFILQLQKNKKAHKIVAIKASAGYLIYIYMPMHSMLPISQVSRYFDRTASHPPCWQCATMTRSLIKTAKIQPLNHPTGESWPGCKSFETLGGDKTKSAGNCTAETALLRICHWIPPSPSRVFPYIPT